MSQLTKIENADLNLPEEVNQALNELQLFQEQKAIMDMKEKEVKKAILKAMQENNVKSFEGDLFKIVYIDESVRKTVDTDELKAQGLYDSFIKESVAKASVRISYK